jgi:hypothetical protein
MVEKRLDRQHTSIPIIIGGLLIGIFIPWNVIIAQHIQEHIKEANDVLSRSLSLSKAVTGELKMSKPAPMFLLYVNKNYFVGS